MLRLTNEKNKETSITSNSTHEIITVKNNFCILKVCKDVIGILSGNKSVMEFGLNGFLVYNVLGLVTNTAGQYGRNTRLNKHDYEIIFQ